MKKYITSQGIFIVFMFLCLIVFAGCAEKKTVITGEGTAAKTAPPAQLAEPAQPPQTTMPGDESAQKDTSAEKSVDLEKMSLKESPVSDINFDYDSSSVRAEAREILKANAGYFLRHRISSIVIEGHCDERGTAEYNMALGERRAQETKKYLMNLGIKESLMTTVSYGEERPLVAESNEEAWAKNRRSHFVVNP